MATDAETIANLEKQVDDLTAMVSKFLDASDKADGDTVTKKQPRLKFRKKEEDEDDMDKGDLTAELSAALGIEKGDLEALMAKARKKPAEGSDEEEADESDDEAAAEGDDMYAGLKPKVKKTKEKDDVKKGKDDVKKTEVEGDTVVIEGQKISKSEVGEATFNVLKAQSEKIAKQDVEVQAAKDEAQMEKLKKQASDLYPHVPGTIDERAAMLKLLATLPEELRKSFETVMGQAEKLAKSAFSTVGMKGRDPEDMQKTARDFDTKISEIVKRDSCSRTDAMSKARREDPEGFKAYQGSN